MSVFIPDLVVDDTPNIRKIKKKYLTKYNIKYKEEYPWALPSSKGDFYAFCQICYVNISIKSVGAKGLRDHEATCRHIQKAHAKIMASTLNPSSSAVVVSQQQQILDGTQNTMVVTSSVSGNCRAFKPNVSISCSAPLRGFSPTSQGQGEHQISSVYSQSSLMAQSQPPAISSTSYPNLEVEEGEMQPVCRSPQTPQTPNTPSISLSQGHLVHKLNQTPPANSQNMNSHISTTKMHLPTLQQNSENCVSDRVHQSELILCTTIQHTSVPGNSTSEGTSNEDLNSSPSDPLSLEDLTCGICSRIFPDWKLLKKDLMEHIKDANAKKSDPQTSGIAENLRKRGTRQTKSKKQSLNASKDTETFSKRRRGRPPGRRKKNCTPESAQIDSTSSLGSQEGSDSLGSKPEESVSLFKMKKQLATKTLPVTTVTKPSGKRRGRPPKNANKPSKQLTAAVEEDISSSSEMSNALSSSMSGNVFTSERVLDICAQQRAEETTQTRTTKTPPTRRSGQLQCRVCRSIFFLRQELKSHYEKEHNNGRPYWCESCDRFFTTKNNLEVHKKHKHIQGPNPCLCTICRKLLSSRTNLKIHMMIHKGEKPFNCPECNKSFSRKANMEMHMVYHTGERRYTCEICGQSFFAINALKRHKKLHSGEREFACDMCNATYVTSTDLRRHRLKHEEIKPYPCSLCDKQFTRGHDLKVHMRYHNKEIRFTCNVCGKQFVESGNYYRHMRKHTGERPYLCAICNQTFSQTHHYKVHVKNNHPDQVDSMNEWPSTHGRPSIHRNPPLNQRATHFKRSQKLSSNVQSQLASSPILSHQLCLPTAAATTTAPMNSLPPEHGQTVHIHNSNHSGPATITNITPVSSAADNLANIQQQQQHSHSSSVATPVAHVPMMTSHHSQTPQTTVNPPPSGFIQYNYIYNSYYNYN